MSEFKSRDLRRSVLCGFQFFGLNMRHFTFVEYNYLITALETIAEDKLTWDNVRDVIYEADKIKNGNAGTAVKTKATNQHAL